MIQYEVKRFGKMNSPLKILVPLRILMLWTKTTISFRSNRSHSNVFIPCSKINCVLGFGSHFMRHLFTVWSLVFLKHIQHKLQKPYWTIKVAQKPNLAIKPNNSSGPFICQIMALFAGVLLEKQIVIVCPNLVSSHSFRYDAHSSK